MPTGLWAIRPGVLAQIEWLQVMTAFGTVGAVIAAVAVPMYQNWDRHREQQRNQLLTEWALAEEVHRISARLRKTGKSLEDSKNFPSEVEIVHMRSQLGIAKQATRDPVGRLVVDGLLNKTVAILDESNRRTTLSKRVDAIGLAVYVSSRKETTNGRIERLESLHEQTYRWMERVLAQFNAMGLDAPGVMKGSGKASISLSASGDGRVQSGS